MATPKKGHDSRPDTFTRSELASLRGGLGPGVGDVLAYLSSPEPVTSCRIIAPPPPRPVGGVLDGGPDDRGASAIQAITVNGSNGVGVPRAQQPETQAAVAVNGNGANRACVECGKAIPASRASNAVTCSPECQAARHKTLQAGRNPRRADQARQRRASLNGALVPPGQGPVEPRPLAGASVAANPVSQTGQSLQADPIYVTMVTERTLSVPGFDPIRTREAQTFQWVPVTNPKEPR